jgi:hypothetical protein
VVTADAEPSGLLTASGRVIDGRGCFVSAGEQLPVDLYDSEKERRADAEQQRAVHRFQGAQHIEPDRRVGGRVEALSVFDSIDRGT